VIDDYDFHPPDDARLFRMPAEGVRRLDDLPPFAFNCDIATPMLRRDDAVFAVDLWLDVLVRSDGVTYAVNDEDDFEEAISHGWLSQLEVASARAELGRLVELIERRELVGFLAAVHPFAPTAAPAAPDMQQVRLSDVALVHAGARPTW
jgi:hypothetical protein